MKDGLHSSIYLCMLEKMVPDLDERVKIDLQIDSFRMLGAYLECNGYYDNY